MKTKHSRQDTDLDATRVIIGKVKPRALLVEVEAVNVTAESSAVLERLKELNNMEQFPLPLYSTKDFFP